jgi:hypothetical protein
MEFGAFLLAFAASASPDLMPVTQTEDGFVFYIRTASVARHPLGHTIRIHAHGPKPRQLVRADPASPWFVTIESAWVISCRQGTYSITEDSFYNDAGDRVAHFTGDAHEQQQPVPGSVSYQLLQAACQRAVSKPMVAAFEADTQ